jgi:hypothetical protein
VEDRKTFEGHISQRSSIFGCGPPGSFGINNVQTGSFDWPKVSSKIHFMDMMHEGDPTAYFLSGFSAFSCIQKALDSTEDAYISGAPRIESGYKRYRSYVERFETDARG